MENDRIDIIPYREDQLAELLYRANECQTPIEFIKTKYHLDYIKEFLSHDRGLQGKFIVVEKQYISKDYLSDYASYYSTCFESYSKRCTRLHLFTYDSDELEAFTARFQKTVIEGVIYNESNRNFWDEYYLGYIVVKPIPSNFIGFTLLRDYNYRQDKPSYKETRNFWALKKYYIHIFGNEVALDSLAFQEQDNNVAACATIAIWSMLQRAAEDYYVILKSPSEITLDTGVTNYDGNRLMPNEGLTPVFIAQAIATNNLVTEVRHVKDHKGKDRFNYYLQKLIYAYAPLKIPVILGVQVPDENGMFRGHAVAVCGYNLQSSETLQIKKTNFLTKLFREGNNEDVILYNASRIDKIYAHDDQWGPFARFELVGGDQIRSSWSQHTGIEYLAEPQVVIISVYPKVRISYDQIEKIIVGLHRVWSDNLGAKLNGEIVWDIRLFLSEDFKNHIQQSPYFDDTNEVDQSVQYHFMIKNFPKYIWVATLMIQNEPVIYFVFDATGLTHSSLIHSILCLYPAIGNAFLDYLNLNKNNPDQAYQGIFGYSIDSYIKKLFEFQKLYNE